LFGTQVNKNTVINDEAYFHLHTPIGQKKKRLNAVNDTSAEKMIARLFMDTNERRNIVDMSVMARFYIAKMILLYFPNQKPLHPLPIKNKFSTTMSQVLFQSCDE